MASATYRVMCEVACRGTHPTTPVRPCLALDRIACETTDEGLRQVTSETALQTMYDTARRTKDQTTVQTTSQTVRGATPQAGVSAWELQAQSLKPQADSPENRFPTNDTNLSHLRPDQFPPAASCKALPVNRTPWNMARARQPSASDVTPQLATSIRSYPRNACCRCPRQFSLTYVLSRHRLKADS
jgi:hypothetical protein